MISISQLWPSLVGAGVGFLLNILFRFLWNRYRFKKELEDNNSIEVGGEWFAAWQTSVDNQQLINTERLAIRQKGKTVKIWNMERAPENPKGGYLWESQMQFFQGRNLMGWYLPLKSENNSSKGIMYFSYFSPKRQFYGKWIGSGYDGELSTGFAVITPERDLSRRLLQDLIGKHGDKVNIIYHTM